MTARSRFHATSRDPGPRPALAGKAADDDDGGVIYGHNRGSGEKEKEGGSREGKRSGIWGQDISKTGYTQTHCTTMNEQEFDRIAARDDRIRTRTSSLVLSFVARRRDGDYLERNGRRMRPKPAIKPNYSRAAGGGGGAGAPIAKPERRASTEMWWKRSHFGKQKLQLVSSGRRH